MPTCLVGKSPRGWKGEGGGGVLGISSDGDDRRICLKFSIPEFFLGRKIWQLFLGVA